MTPIIRTAATQRLKLSWLDLNKKGFSVLERLCIEEALLRHDPLQRCWGIVGTHDPFHNRILSSLHESHINQNNNTQWNENCLIVLGIGGKPEKLLNLDLVRDEGVVCIKRFSGGGTVVVDHSSILTTFIMRTEHLPHVPPYPRDIMKWSSDAIYDSVFTAMKHDVMTTDGAAKNNNNNSGGQKKSLVMEAKSCGVELTNKMIMIPHNETIPNIPNFSLRENDYVLGDRKMGGNAQSIVKGGWLHHTSFLWDYCDQNMKYLTLPEKRPDYRGERSHDDFLVKLKQYYEYHPLGKDAMYKKTKQFAEDIYDVEEVTLAEVLEMIDVELGGLQNWFDGRCRTKLIKV